MRAQALFDGVPAQPPACAGREQRVLGSSCAFARPFAQRRLGGVREGHGSLFAAFASQRTWAVKAAHVFDLYERIWEARPLGGDGYVLSADEKPGVQVRRRIHPGLPPRPGRPMRVENEYARCGILAHLAAYDVHRGQVMGRCEPTTGIKRFAISAQRVFWVVDDGASHRAGQRPPG